MVASGELDGLCYIPTLPEFLRFIAQRYAQLPALGQDETTYTYAELVSRTARRAACLNSLGLPKGAHIGVLAPNDLDAMELFLAIPAVGFTVMMLPASLGSEQVAGLSRKYDLAALFAAPACAAAAAGAACPVYPADAIAETEAAFADTTRETPAAIFLTGGTSGMPKGAVLSHGALMRGALNGIYGPDHILHQRYMALLPLSHVFGSIRGLLACLYIGSVVYACPDLKAALMQLPVLRPTILVLVPGMIDIILGIAKPKGRGFLGDLRVIIAGAAPVPHRLMQECAGYGIQVCAGYGLTECANLTAGNADTDVLPEAVGPAYPEQEVKIENGELLIRGDNVMLGYYGEPELTAQVLVDGWFHTGDLAQLKEFRGGAVHRHYRPCKGHHPAAQRRERFPGRDRKSVLQRPAGERLPCPPHDRQRPRGHRHRDPALCARACFLHAGGCGAASAGRCGCGRPAAPQPEAGPEAGRPHAGLQAFRCHEDPAELESCSLMRQQAHWITPRSALSATVWKSCTAPVSSLHTAFPQS